MSEDIIVDNTIPQNEELFGSLFFLGVNITCHKQTIILDYSDTYDVRSWRIPPELKDEFSPENFTIWKFSMPCRMSIVDYVIQFGIQHEDLHIVIDSIFKDSITRKKLDFVHACIIDSAECFVFLHSLITEMTSQEICSLVSQIYTELDKRDYSDIPHVWVPPDMRG